MMDIMSPKDFESTLPADSNGQGFKAVWGWRNTYEKL